MGSKAMDDLIEFEKKCDLADYYSCGLGGDGKPLILSYNYWDCSCDERYIHDKSFSTECPKCGATDDDMPDSRANELKLENMFIEVSA